MAAALPKRHLVAVTQKAPEFRLLVFYRPTLCVYFMMDGWMHILGFKISTIIHCHYKDCKSQNIF